LVAGGLLARRWGDGGKPSPSATVVAVLAALCLAAFALHLRHLGAPSADGAQRIDRALLPWWRFVTFTVDERHGPLWYVLLRGSLALGADDAFAQAPALVAGVALVGATFSLARRWASDGWALLAAAVVAVHPAIGDFSTEIGPTTTFACTATLALGAWTDVLRGATGRLRAAMAWLVAGLLTSYAAVPLAAVLLAFAARQRLSFRAVRGLLALATLPVLAFAVGAVGDLAHRRLAHQFPTLAWGDASPAATLVGFAALLGPGPWAGAAGLAAAAGAAWGRRRDAGAAIGVAALALPLAFAAAAPWLRVKPYYAFGAIPALWTLAIAAGAALRPQSRAARVAAGVALVAAALTPPLAVSGRPYRQQGDAAFATVARHLAE
ncbi:MAG: glycosyltransferase family 39 protein, partial [Myxococcota bacterium]